MHPAYLALAAFALAVFALFLTARRLWRLPGKSAIDPYEINRHVRRQREVM